MYKTYYIQPSYNVRIQFCMTFNLIKKQHFEHFEYTPDKLEGTSSWGGLSLQTLPGFKSPG